MTAMRSSLHIVCVKFCEFEVRIVATNISGNRKSITVAELTPIYRK